MKGGWCFALLAVGPLLGGAGPRVFGGDDDLSIVKRAVDVGGATAARAESPARRSGEAQWLRIRIQDKGQKKAKVSVNLPLSVVRALGEDWVLDGGHSAPGRSRGHGVTLGEVLRRLDAGQELVQIEDETSSIRVFVE